MELNELSSNPLSWITFTFLVYWGATYLHRRTRLTLLNPLIITIAIVIVALKLTDTTFETYYDGGHLIEFWLKPAIVALALPLYQEIKHIKNQFLPIFITELVGSFVGIVSAVLIAHWFGATDEVVRSLAAKSVSTPIAIEITHKLGGIPALTSAIVVLVGMIGAVVGLKTLSVGHVNNSVSRSLSMGTAAHVMGTNRVSMFSDRFGAYATLGLIINGILTAFLAGPLVNI